MTFNQSDLRRIYLASGFILTISRSV